MKIAYFDCFAGIAGDMCLGALVDLGVGLDTIDAAVRSLGIDGFRLEAHRVDRAGLGGTKVDVHMTGEQPERHLSEIEAILGGGSLAPEVRDRALAVFRHLARAESRAHQVPIEQVHLHEVGALDAIVDVVGTCAGLAALGVERVHASPVVVGRGMATGEHGPIPIPGPATIEVLRGVPVKEGPVLSEMTTPTGAALIATLATAFGPMPDLQIYAAGYGAGTRDFEAVPNLLRVILGEAAAPAMGDSESAVVVEANLDDLSPQLAAHALDRLLAEGALDAWLTPVVMKKGRPGLILSALVRPGAVAAASAVFFAETTTFGVRASEWRRAVLARAHVAVDTAYGSVRVKVASDASGNVLSATPEYEDCLGRARERGVALKEVQAAALAAFRARPSTGRVSNG